MRSTLGALRDDLAALDDVAAVVSILDVPLISSPAVALRDLPDGIRTLADPSTDAELARKELLSSPLYADYVISRSGRTTALRVDFLEDQLYIELRNRRDQGIVI